MPEKTEKKQAREGRWKAGQSGNPSGRPKGSRNRATLAVEALLEGEAEKLTRKAVELALGGDTTALRLCLERIAPPAKERPLEIDLPSVNGPGDLPSALAAVLGAVSRGEVTPGEAEKLGRLANSYIHAVEARDFEVRLQALEEAQERRLRRV
jgi:hypothetical protein